MPWEDLQQLMLSPHLRYDPDLGSTFCFFVVSLFLYSLLIVLTGSVVLVSLNVDPVLYTAYPFILPLWIAQAHALVTCNHTFSSPD